MGYATLDTYKTLEEAEMYLLETESGKKIEATGCHKFWTPDGWKKLEDLTFSDTINVHEDR